MGSVKVCEFYGLQSAGKNYQLISQKLHFPRPNSRSKKKIAMQNHKERTSYQF